jgi:glycosyltransferase involved in cell wall biosynthesis
MRHELHLITFAQSAADMGYRDELLKVFRKVHFIYLPGWRSALNCLAALWNPLPVQVLYFQLGEMRRQLDALLKQYTYEAIHVQHLRMAPYLERRKDLPRILDLPDAFSLYWERRRKMPGNFLKKAFERIEQKRVLKYEPVMKQYNLALACSAEDMAYLREKHSVANLELLPNGVDLDTFRAGGHDYTHNHTLLFTGNMDYAPNVDAVLYFTEAILPLIRKAYPEVQFVIAGQRPVPKVLALAGNGVVVTGFIENLADTYNAASIVVAPLRFGAGTQNKVLEAMAMGIPVVCSAIGFKGLSITSGEGAFMEPERDAFAQRVVALLGDAALRETTGRKGAAVIQSRFSWDAIAGKLEGYFEGVAL